MRTRKSLLTFVSDYVYYLSKHQNKENNNYLNFSRNFCEQLLILKKLYKRALAEEMVLSCKTFKRK